MRCIAGEAVHLDPTQKAVARVNESSGVLAASIKNIVPENMHSGRRGCLASQLEVDARAPTRTTPRHDLRIFKLLDKTTSLRVAMLKHVAREGELFFCEWPITFHDV